MRKMIFLSIVLFLIFQEVVLASTTIGSTSVLYPFYTNVRSICRDGQGYLHVVWRCTSSTITYANSTDNGLTWNVNNTLYSGSPVFPSISCDGNNIYVAFEDTSLDDIIVLKSTNNGGVFTQLTSPVTSSVKGDEGISIETRGDRVYIVYLDSVAPRTIKFVNSTDGGSSWGSTKAVIYYIGSSAYFPSLSVDGNGGANDKIYVIGKSLLDEIYFTNSTDSGVNWGINISIMPTFGYSYSIGSITFNSTNLYVSGVTNIDGLRFTNSTDSGISWTLPYRIDTGSYYAPSVTIDKNGYPIVFWGIPPLYEIVFRKYNGTDWEDIVYVTNITSGGKLISTKYNFNNNRIEFIWKQGNNIVYDYLSDAPRVEEITLVNSTPYTNATLNCSAKYWSLVNNGRLEFIWYKTNSSGSYLMNYNGSTANNLKIGQIGYTNVTVSYLELLKSDNWTCSVRAWNTTHYSSWLNSSVWTVLGESNPPTWSSITASPASPVIYSASQIYTFQSTWTDNVAVNDVIFQFDGTNYSYLSGELTKSGNIYSKTLTGLSVGTHEYKWFASDTSNNWNSTSLYTYQVKEQELPPTTQPPQPVEIPPPEEPTEYPTEEISIPTPGAVITLPETGATIRLEPNFVLTLYPLTNLTAVIHNISKIEEPSKYKILLCNQTLISSYEIEITVDLAYFCANYSGYNVEDPTVNIFKFEENDWIPMEAKDIAKNPVKKIICGKISSTPYMITGFAPTVDSQTALLAIESCDKTIITAKEQGIDVSKAEEFLEKAWFEYYSCNYAKAKEFVDKALESLVVPPIWLIPISFAAVAVIGLAWLWYYSVRIKVRVRR